jgi:nitrous oxidase accessory protein NosD
MLLWLASCGGTVGQSSDREPATLAVPEDYATVHEAMKQALAGDVIVVAAGEHRGGVEIKSGVTLRGAGRDRTILWSATDSVVTARYVQNVLIEDMRLEGRYASNHEDGPLWVINAAVTLRNCHARGATLSGIEAEGARTELVVVDSVIEENRASGISLQMGARGRIARNQIRQNGRAGINIGGRGTYAHVVDNIIVDNRTSGISLYNGISLYEAALSRIERNAVIGNGHGVAVKDAGSNLVLQHNVFFRNRQNGVWVYGKSSAMITDNIIAGNGYSGISADGVGYGVAGSPRATHNLFWDNKRDNFRGFEVDPSNIEADPGFLDANAWDFRLAAGSPARGAGSDGDDIGLYPRMVPPSALTRRPQTEAKGDTKAESYRLPAAPRVRGRSLAVVVGVQNYDDPGIKDLKYTDDDAERVAAFLQSQGYEVRKLINGDAKLAEVRGALLWLASAGADDRVVFYFSGHGSDEPNPLGDDQGFLLTSDTRLFDASKKERRLAATALPLSELRQAMDRTAARRVSVLLDACFAAGAKSVSAPRRGVKAVGDSEITGGLTFGEGKVALYSSRDNEPSLEADRHRHGYFTHYLLEAWQAGKRSADDVYRHVHAGVTRDTNGAQHPRKEYREAEGAVPIY